MASVPQFELPFSSDIAFQKLIDAGNKVGKVEESSPIAKFVIIKARYGLNPVRVRLAVTSVDQEKSVVEMQARGQDVWGVASRTVMDRIIAAIQ